MSEELNICCSDFAKAFESGTDGEGYGALFYVDSWRGMLVDAGCHPSPINFCPWCGKPVTFCKKEAGND